jgi:hypothetical protein
VCASRSADRPDLDRDNGGTPAAARPGAVFSAVVEMRSAGVTAKMSHSADSTGRDSRSGVPVTRRWTWEADSVMPRSASGGISSVVLNMPCAAITSRSRHR